MSTRGRECRAPPRSSGCMLEQIVDALIFAGLFTLGWALSERSKRKRKEGE